MSEAENHNALIARRLKQRSPEALEDLLDEYGAKVQALAFSIVGDHHAAEDVTAETFAAAWIQIGSLRNDRRLRPWLLAIGTRTALQHLRRARPRTGQLNSADDETAFEASSVDRLTVRAAMDQLPPRMRAAIALRYLADLPVAEIAVALGRSQNTVKTELRIGLGRLRDLLSD